MPNLIGTDPSQVPTNGMLGTAAFVDEATLVKNTGTQAPVSIAVNSSSPALTITQDGVGNALEVRDVTGDSTPFVVAGNGQVSFGHPTQPFFISGVVPNVVSIGTSNIDGGFAAVRYSADTGGTFVHLAKSRGAAGAQGLVSSGDTAGVVSFSASDGAIFTPLASITAQVDGTPGTNDMPGMLVFSTTRDGQSSPTEALRIDSNQVITARNSNGLGYGTGSGGTVTQTSTAAASLVNGTVYTITSVGTTDFVALGAASNTVGVTFTKSGGAGSGTGTAASAADKGNAVTLNKPSGQITMANGPLAAGGNVVFNVNCSAVAINDTVIVTTSWVAVEAKNYDVDVVRIGNGVFSIRVRNITASSYSDAITINYTVLKGSTS